MARSDLSSRRAALDHLLSRCGQDGRDFERLCGWLLLNDPRFRGEVAEVLDWDDWEYADGPDDGVDLVAVTHGGEFWAIQAKGYAEDGRITKTHVDSFLASSSDRRFTRRLLIASNEWLSRNAQRSLRKVPERKVEWFPRSRLEQAAVTWPRSPGELLPLPPKRMRLRAYQREAVAAIVDQVPLGGRGRVTMACGTGKTVVAIRAAERLGSESTLVVAPTLALIGQLIDEWKAQSRSLGECLAVCSDESVFGGADAVPDQLESLGLRVTTDPDAIAEFLRRPGEKTVFSTYHSSPAVAAAFSPTLAPFDLLVADEAHWAATTTSSAYATILHEEVPARRRLFFTATPRCYSLADRTRAIEDHAVRLASMDDLELFGPEVYKLGFGDAIRLGQLADYRIVVSLVRSPEHLRLVHRQRPVTFRHGHTTDAEMLATQTLVLRASRRWRLRRIVTYHSRRRTARAFARTLPDTARRLPTRARLGREVWAHSILGETPTGERRRLLRAFGRIDERLRVVTNVSCLTEGVDVPAVDAVAILDPKKSINDIIQAVGRALRTGGRRNKVATIIVPVYVPDGADVDRCIAASAFDGVVNVILALRHHDDRFTAELNDHRMLLSRGGSATLPDRIHIDDSDLPTTIDQGFLRSFTAHVVKRAAQSTVQIERALLASSSRTLHEPDRDEALLSARAIRSHGVDALTSYVAREGHSAAPIDHIEDQFPLGAWLPLILREADRRGIEQCFQAPRDAKRFLQALRPYDLPLGTYWTLERQLDPTRNLDRFCQATVGSGFPPELLAVAPPPPECDLPERDAWGDFVTYQSEVIFTALVESARARSHEDRYLAAVLAVKHIAEIRRRTARFGTSPERYYLDWFITGTEDIGRRGPVIDELDNLRWRHVISQATWDAAVAGWTHGRDAAIEIAESVHIAAVERDLAA